MYHVQLVGRGLGYIPEGPGGYKCGTQSCYSFQSPQTHELLLKFQAILNELRAKLNLTGIDALEVAGQIGPKTAALATAIVNAVPNSQDRLKYTWMAANLEPGAGDYKTYTKYADKIVPELELFLGQFNAGPPPARPNLKSLRSFLPIRMGGQVGVDPSRVGSNIPNTQNPLYPMGSKTAPGPSFPAPPPPASAATKVPKWVPFAVIGAAGLIAVAVISSTARRPAAG